MLCEPRVSIPNRAEKGEDVASCVFASPMYQVCIKSIGLMALSQRLWAIGDDASGLIVCICSTRRNYVL